MTRLELAQDLLLECGLGGSISTTLNQTGEAGQLVSWIDKAYKDILNSSKYWRFMRAEFVLPITNGDSTYSYTDASITAFSHWLAENDDFRCYTTTTADEQWLVYCPWEEFRMVYLMGSSRTQAGRPMFFSVKPDNTLIFSPIPNGSFNVTGEYYKAPAAMTADADEPVFPSQYHSAVVYRALMMFAQYHSEPDKFASGQNEFRRIMQAMKSTELPQIGWGPPLA